MSGLLVLSALFVPISWAVASGVAALAAKFLKKNARDLEIRGPTGNTRIVVTETMSPEDINRKIVEVLHK